MPKVKDYLKVYCSSDWHNPPDRLEDSVRRFIEEAKAGGADLVIGVGDLFDLADYPWKRFADEGGAIQQLGELLKGHGLEFIYIEGNHDPIYWIDKVIAPKKYPYLNFPNLEVFHGKEKGDVCAVNVGDSTYHFVHGDQWALDWKWLRKLSRLTIPIASLGPIRRLTHWWVSRMNPAGIKRKALWLEREAKRAQEKWQAKREQDKGSPDWRKWDRQAKKAREERERYNQVTGWIHGGASGHAETNKCVVVCGHTHKPWEAAADEDTPRLYDDGDMVDSCRYLVIDEKGVTSHKLKGKCQHSSMEDGEEGSLDKVTLRILQAAVTTFVLGLGIALLPIPISISTLLAGYPSLPGQVLWLARWLLIIGVGLFVIGSVLDWVAQLRENS